MTLAHVSTFGTGSLPIAGTQSPDAVLQSVDALARATTKEFLGRETPYRAADPVLGREPERAVLNAATSPADIQATFCATLLDEWVRAGISRAVVSPGSRSTPMALALAADSRIELYVVVDERSASFLALGMAKAARIPVIVLCTSGTAAVEYHPAVVEADLDHVPLLVCTADRPKELHGIGAPQTVDQQHLYGRSVRLFLDLPVAELDVAPTWRSTASRIVLAATSGAHGPGPVHINLGFREPLVGNPATLPPGRPNGAPWHSSALSPRDPRSTSLASDPSLSGASSTSSDSSSDHFASAGIGRSVVEAVASRLIGKRGVIVAGADCGDAVAIHELASALRWPVLADSRSGARLAGTKTLVANADSILRHDSWAEQHRAEVVLRLGAPWASKVVNQWLAHSPDDVLVDPDHAWLDPNRAAALHVSGDPSTLCRVLQKEVTRAHSENDGSWLNDWRCAEETATEVLVSRLDSDAARNSTTIVEPALARALVRFLPSGAALVVSSSMPIRDVEWFGGERSGIAVLANRGANGIDGVLSTAFGVAAVHGGPTVCLIGDLAFLHDVGALSIAAQKRINATVVIVDNRGGGIFEFLPQATGVARERFELLYGTEQHVNLADVCRAFGLQVTEASTINEVLAATNKSQLGARIVIVHTNRQSNVEVHRDLNAAIIAAIG